jgi:predicted PurR-regulated permease PerM
VLRFLFDFRNARFAVLLLLVVLTIIAVVFFRAVMLPFFLAAFLAYLLDPPVSWMHEHVRIRKRHLPRGFAILIIYAVLGTVLGLSGYYGIPKLIVELNRMVRTLPSILNELETDIIRPAGGEIDRILSTYLAAPPSIDSDSEDFMPLDTLKPIDSQAPPAPPAPPAKVANPTTDALRPLVEDYVFVARPREDGRWEIMARPKRPKPANSDKSGLSMNLQLNQVFQDFRSNLEENMGGVIEQGRGLLKRVTEFVFDIFLVFMLAGFMLVDPTRIRNFLRSMIPAPYHGAYEKWVSRLDHGLSGVVRGQVVICLLNGLVTGVGIYFLGVPFWFTLSILATVFSLVPIFGVLISSVPIVIMALTVGLYTALLAVGWILIVHFLEGNFLNPKILGDAANIHPVLIVFALVVGQYIGGITGALLAVPTFSLLYNSFKFLKQQAEDFEQRVT